MEIIRSIRGHKKMLHNGFSYVVRREYNDRINWCCEKTRCGGIASTFKKQLVYFKPHNHPSDHSRNKLLMAVDGIKERAKYSSEQTSVLIKEELRRRGLEPSAIPNMLSLERMVQRKRAQSRSGRWTKSGADIRNTHRSSNTSTDIDQVSGRGFMVKTNGRKNDAINNDCNDVEDINDENISTALNNGFNDENISTALNNGFNDNYFQINSINDNKVETSVLTNITNDNSRLNDNNAFYNNKLRDLCSETLEVAKDRVDLTEIALESLSTNLSLLKALTNASLQVSSLQSNVSSTQPANNNNNINYINDQNITTELNNVSDFNCLNINTINDNNLTNINNDINNVKDQIQDMLREALEVAKDRGYVIKGISTKVSEALSLSKALTNENLQVFLQQEVSSKEPANKKKINQRHFINKSSIQGGIKSRKKPSKMEKADILDKFDVSGMVGHDHSYS